MAEIEATTLPSGAHWLRIDIQEGDKGLVCCQAWGAGGSSLTLSHCELSILAALRDELTRYLKEQGAKPLRG